MYDLRITKTLLPLIAATLVLGACRTANPHESAPAEPTTTPTVATTPAPEGSVPAGTLAMVRTTQTIDSQVNGAGHRFTLALEGDLVAADGTVVARKGSTVYGQLAEAKKSGRLAGKSEMTIVFTGISIDNQIKPISTTAIKAVTEGTGKNTAKSVAAGAAIGGIAGGSKKAKRGAAVGLGASVLTSGNQIRIPAGTILEFQFADHLVP